MVGWWVVHWLNSFRDQANKRRELIVGYLVGAYRNLERAAFAETPEDHRASVESAIADIQLFGSAKQVKLAQEFSNRIAADGTAGIEQLLEELRIDLRKELNLDAVGRGIVIFRLRELCKTQPDQSLNQGAPESSAPVSSVISGYGARIAESTSERYP